MASAAASKMLTRATNLMSSSASSSLAHRQRRRLSCSAARLVPSPPDLARWVRREGGFVHPKLKIADHPAHGLGIIADEEIPQGTELIALPGHLPLRFERSSEGDSDDVLMQLATRVPVCAKEYIGTHGEPVTEELWAMRLGLRLLQERAAVGSFWWPYISNLPEAFSVPIFFSGEDIKNLQYAPLVHQVNKRCRFLLEFEKEIKNVLSNIPSKDHPFGGQNVNASSLGWAMSAVSSRAFRLRGKTKGEDVPMLLPLIDMCNHSFNPNARIIQEEDTSSPKMLVKVVADTEIEKDAPIILNYGCLCNDLFLLDYGFVIPSNQYDSIELRYDSALLEAASMAAGVSSTSFSSPAIWQQEILCKLNLQGDAAVLKVCVGGPDLVDGRLLAALRILLTDDKETVQSQDLPTLMSLSDKAPLGVPVEIAVLRTAIALTVVALEHFPTKIMQDESILKGDVSSSMELALQFRMQKKLMLIDVMRKLTQKVRLFSQQKAAAQS